MKILSGALNVSLLFCLNFGLFSYEQVSLAAPGVVRGTSSELAASLSKIQAEGGLVPFQVTVWNKDGAVAFDHALGTNEPGKIIPVASASKWIAAATILTLVDAGKLSLASTTGDILGWKGEKGTITLQHLLSLRSGLSTKQKCLVDATTSLESCVNNVAQSELVTPPGARFEYGSVHLSVAARMAEKATGLSWNQVYQKYLGAPLLFSFSSRFYNNSIAKTGAVNPSIGGGLVISAVDYEKFLRFLFHRGMFNGKRVLSEESVRNLEMDNTSQATLPRLPARFPGDTFAQWHYNLGNWRECASPQSCSGEQIFSSVGAFGFFPWIDRKNGVYALINMFDAEVVPAPVLIKKNFALNEVHASIVKAFTPE